jgi:hypothetical protein
LEDSSQVSALLDTRADLHGINVYDILTNIMMNTAHLPVFERCLDDKSSVESFQEYLQASINTLLSFLGSGDSVSILKNRSLSKTEFCNYSQQTKGPEIEI